jgi:hypothetical protein
MATAAATGVIASSLFRNDSEENKDLDMENNACSEEGDLDIETEPRRDGFQELCLVVLKFGFFSFVRFDAKGWYLVEVVKVFLTHRTHSQAEKLRNLNMTHHQVRKQKP